jgi:hypothetical protein
MGRILLAAFVLLLTAVPVLAGEIVTYEKDIKGIIARQCILCHDAKSPTMEVFDGIKRGSLTG